MQSLDLPVSLTEPQHNPFVVDYLLGKREPPVEIPPLIGWGDETEAVAYVQDSFMADQRIDEAETLHLGGPQPYNWTGTNLSIGRALTFQLDGH